MLWPLSISVRKQTGQGRIISISSNVGPLSSDYINALFPCTTCELKKILDSLSGLRSLATAYSKAHLHPNMLVKFCMEEAGFLSRLDLNCSPTFFHNTQHAIRCTNNAHFLSVLPHYGHYCQFHRKILQSSKQNLSQGPSITCQIINPRSLLRMSTAQTAHSLTAKDST
jgi:hypothetical protein